jgi:hypothetical protein
MAKSKKILELVSFNMESINIQSFSKTSENEIKYKLNFDYDIATNEKDVLLYRLKLTCKLQPVIPKTGYKIESAITGYFRVPNDIDENKKMFLVCYNGGIILIGTLRGIIANATGSFPDGNFILPTIDMMKVIEKVEKQRKGN